MDIEEQLLMISDKEIEPQKATEALNWIYTTYRDFIFTVVKKNIYFTKEKNDISKTITNDVFLYVWDNPLKWEFNSETHNCAITAFKAYLSQVAKNLLRNELRKSETHRLSVINVDSSETDFFDTFLNPKEIEVVSKNANLIEQALEQLKPHNRDIVRMYYVFYETNKNMTSESLEALEIIFNTTRVNIRQIISRAKKTIKGIVTSQVQIKN